MDRIVTDGLDKAARALAFPLPLRGAGYLPENMNVFKGVYKCVDLGVRLSGRTDRSIVRIDGKKMSMRYPCALICAPGARYENLSEGPWECLYLSYDVRLFTVFKSMGVDFNERFWEIDMTDSLSLLVRSFAGLMPAAMERGVSDRLDALGWGVWSEVLLSKSAASGQSMPNEGKIRLVASQLCLRFREAVDMEALVARHGMSMRTFFRSWGRIYNVPPSAYVEELRMCEAVRLLEDTDMSMQEVASAVGFGDVFYFSRRFKACRGEPPSSRRARCRGRGRLPVG